MCEFYGQIDLGNKMLPAMRQPCEDKGTFISEGKDRARAKLVRFEGNVLVFRVKARVGGKSRQRTVKRAWENGIYMLPAIEIREVLKGMQNNA